MADDHVPPHLAGTHHCWQSCAKITVWTFTAEIFEKQTPQINQWNSLCCQIFLNQIICTVKGYFLSLLRLMEALCDLAFSLVGTNFLDVSLSFCARSRSLFVCRELNSVFGEQSVDKLNSTSRISGPKDVQTQPIAGPFATYYDRYGLNRDRNSLMEHDKRTQSVPCRVVGLPLDLYT